MGMLARAKRFGRALGQRASLLAGKGLRSSLPLSQARFLERFDAAVMVDVAASIAARETSLLDHFDARVQSGWLEAPKVLTDLRIDFAAMDDTQVIARADAAIDNDLHPSGVRPSLRDGHRIDWSANPADSREWLLMVHRHAWWALWAEAYRRTGNDKYAVAFVEQMLDWIDNNPMPPFKSEHQPSWRLMECGLRLRIGWIPAFGIFYRAAAFTDEAKLTMLRSIYDHCRFLNSYFTNRNHLVRESNGLVAAALAFPEFRESSTWLEAGLARLAKEVREQVNEDGSHIEMSTGYQWLSIDEFETTRSLLEPSGRSLPDTDLSVTLERMYEYLAHLMRPDRRFPQLNDGFILWDADRLETAVCKRGRSDLVFAASAGARGRKPDGASRSFPQAGVHVMRSGFEANDSYLVFDTGPYGGPHGHEDKLSLELFARGTPFVVDPGSYTYQLDDPYREYFVGSRGHNTVLVDGKSQVRRWHDAHLSPQTCNDRYGDWRSDEQFDWAIGHYDEGYADFAMRCPDGASVDNDASHTRQVIFVKPSYWIVVDDMHATREHSYSALFHLGPDVEVLSHDRSGAVAKSTRNAATLKIVAITAGDAACGLHCGEESPIQGWYSEDHHRKAPSPALEFTVVAPGATSFAWVLVPSEKTEAEDIDSIEAMATDGGFALQVLGDEISIKTPGKPGDPSRVDIRRRDGTRWSTT